MTLPVTSVFYLYVIRNVNNIYRDSNPLGLVAGNSTGVWEFVCNITNAKRSD
jgi:hypothetical protein